jgi:hypothetical protein
MDGKISEQKQVNRKKIVIFSLILILLAAVTVFFVSAKTSNRIIDVTTTGPGDYNCDGWKDQVEINRALAYVAENPQFTTVYLKGPGTYVISDSIFIGNNTVLEGDSTAVIKLKENASWVKEKPLITQIDRNKSHDIVIRGFEIDGNHDNNSEYVNGKGYYNLIHLVNSTNVFVHDMYMHDSHGDGLKVSRSSNIKFYNNNVYNLGHDALYVINSANVQAWNNNITCRTNSGLRIYNTNHVKFHNNVISSRGQGGAGIEIQKFTPATATNLPTTTNPEVVMDDVEICNNMLNQTHAAGIWVFGYGSEYPNFSAKNVYIHHNMFHETGTNGGAHWAGGIVLNGFQNTLIENNFFDGCYGAAIAHKEVTEEFSAPSSGYTTVVKDNIIINTQPSRTAGKGYAVFNNLSTNHSFILKNNCLSNNSGGNYMYENSTSDFEFHPGFVEQVSKNESMKEYFPWSRAISSGAQRPYQIDSVKAVENLFPNRVEIFSPYYTGNMSDKPSNGQKSLLAERNYFTGILDLTESTFSMLRHELSVVERFLSAIFWMLKLFLSS